MMSELSPETKLGGKPGQVADYETLQFRRKEAVARRLSSRSWSQEKLSRVWSQLTGSVDGLRLGPSAHGACQAQGRQRSLNKVKKPKQIIAELGNSAILVRHGVLHKIILCATQRGVRGSLRPHFGNRRGVVTVLLSPLWQSRIRCATLADFAGSETTLSLWEAN